MRYVLLATLFLTSAVIGEQSKLPLKPMLASALLPGTGELLLGSRTKGEIFLWTEAAFFGLYAGFLWHGRTRNQDAKLLAYRYADANLSSNSDDYFDVLEDYDNSEECNLDILREARRIYPDFPDSQQIYLEEHGYFEDESWDWESDSLRIQYWRTRRSARNTLRRANTTLGMMAISRIISIIDCALFTKQTRFSLRSEGTGIRFSYHF